MQRPGLSARLTGAGLVVALHVPLIAGLLYTNLAPGGVRRVIETQHQTEMVLPLPPLPPKSTAPVKGPERNGLGSVVSPDASSLFFSPSASAGALGEALFRCTPEHIGQLSAEERQRCAHMGGFSVAALMTAPMHFDPKPDKLSNSDIAARQRNTADPCAIAKMSKMAGAECIHEVLYGKGLP